MKRINKAYTTEDCKHLLNWDSWATTRTDAAKIFIKKHDRTRKTASILAKIYDLEKKQANGRPGVEVRGSNATQTVVATKIAEAVLGHTNLKILSDQGEMTIIIPSRKFKINGISISWGI